MVARFSDIIDQDQACGNLQNAIETGRVAHAYLIEGPAGSGKRMLADAFAQTLECDRGGRDACGECRSCHQVQTHNHPDIIYVTHEKPLTISVDDILDQVVSDAPVRPYNGGYKIYIIDEAEKMTVPAQNKLLKTLEEPPAYAVILLLTVNAGLMLETIRSRCILIRIKPVRDELVQKYLMEHIEVPDYQARLCAAFAQGNIGKAMKLASSENFTQMRELALKTVTRVGQMDLVQINIAVNEISQYKDSIHDFLDILSIWYRDVLYFKATTAADELVFRDQLTNIRGIALRASYEGLEQVLEAIRTCRTRLDANVSFNLAVELLLMTMKDHA